MAQRLRFGVLGTGNIAKQFAAGLAQSSRSEITAVGSRTQASADGFAKTYSIASAHADYDSLLVDPNVDAIYLSLPNSMHHEWTIKSLRAGKHVLCEKPIATDAAQAEEMFDVAKKHGKLVVEAFMYRSHPQTQAIVETIRSGEIGRVKLIKTSFCFRVANTAGNIRFDPILAGGAMMDIGCYCLNFSRLIAGAEPEKISAVASLHSSGVDEWVSVAMQFPNGILGSFVCGMTVQADNTAYICGDEGYLEIGWPWKPQRKASFKISHSTPPKQEAKTGATVRAPSREISVESPAELYALEADDFAASVLDGAPLRISREDTIGNMNCLDEIRKQIGVKFKT